MNDILELLLASGLSANQVTANQFLGIANPPEPTPGAPIPEPGAPVPEPPLPPPLPDPPLQPDPPFPQPQPPYPPEETPRLGKAQACLF